MGAIKVTQIERNGKSVASLDMLLPVGSIVEPLLENASNKTIINVQESIVQARQAEVPNSVQYIVDEALAAVVALSPEIFSATVVSRSGRELVPGASTKGFVLGRIVGGIRNLAGGGSTFFYHEDGDYAPVEYVVLEDAATIELSL